MHPSRSQQKILNEAGGINFGVGNQTQRAATKPSKNFIEMNK